MNRIPSVLLVLTVIAFTVTTASSFDENTTIETSDLGAQIIDAMGHSLIETKNNLGDLLAVIYLGVLASSAILLLSIALLMMKRKKGQ